MRTAEIPPEGIIPEITPLSKLPVECNVHVVTRHMAKGPVKSVETNLPLSCPQSSYFMQCMTLWIIGLGHTGETCLTSRTHMSGNTCCAIVDN